MLVAGTAFAQKTERDYLRSGNKLYKDSLFIKSEVDYRKALDVEPQSADAMYNLSNSLLMQEKAKEAMEMLETTVKVEKDKDKLAEAYHNMGVIQHASKQYAPAIESYKNALRNNPKDDETRYNLALAQKMLKDQEQNQENQDQNEDQKEDKKEQEQDQNKDQNKDQQDQKKDDQKEQDEKDKQEQQQQQQNPNQMSKENAEQLLNAVMKDEKEVQEKVQKQLQMQGKKLEKDW